MSLRPASSIAIEPKASSAPASALFDSLQRLLQVNASGASRWVLVPMIHNLRADLLTHFGNEEAALTCIGYGGIDGQLSVHARLMYEFEKHMSEFKSGENFSPAFVKFLHSTLTSYILRSEPPFVASHLSI
jgi:hemerythrin